MLSSLENALNSLAKWIEAHGQPLVVAPHNLQAGSAGVMQQPCCPSMAAKEIAVDRRKHPTDCCSQDVNACNGGACWKVSSSTLCYFLISQLPQAICSVELSCALIISWFSTVSPLWMCAIGSTLHIVVLQSSAWRCLVLCCQAAQQQATDGKSKPSSQHSTRITAASSEEVHRG